MKVELGASGYAEIEVSCPLMRAELGVFLKQENVSVGFVHEILVGVKGEVEQPKRRHDFVVRAPSFEYYLDRRSGHARAYLSYPIDSWQLACPLRQLFAWLVDMERGVLLHAGAIDLGDYAVILAGPSGSGKSSICAATLRPIFGDDWIIVNASGGKVEVTSLYSSVKLLPSSASAIKPHRPATALVTDKGKRIYHDGVSMQRRQSVGALIVPEITKESGVIGTKKLDPFEAFRRIAPSTLLQSQGVSESSLTRIRKICEALPCYAVSFSLDMVESVPRIIQGLR